MRSSNTVIDAQGKGVDQTDPLKFHPCATSVGSDNAPDPETGAELMRAKLAARDTAADVADKTKANNDTPTAEPIPFNDAIREGKEILAQKSASESKCQWRLGELADKVETAYREGTLKRFAKAIGISGCTPWRYRDVYRAWKDISAPGRGTFSHPVARRVAAPSHPAENLR